MTEVEKNYDELNEVRKNIKELRNKIENEAEKTSPTPEVETRTVVADTAVAKEVETRTVVTDTAVEKTAPEPKETKTYIVFNREAVNPKSLDQYEAPGHQKLNGATVIRVKTRE